MTPRTSQGREALARAGPDRLVTLTGRYAQQHALSYERLRWPIIGMIACSLPALVEGDDVMAVVGLVGWIGLLGLGCGAAYLAPRWRRTGTAMLARAEQSCT